MLLVKTKVTVKAGQPTAFRPSKEAANLLNAALKVDPILSSVINQSIEGFLSKQFSADKKGYL